MKRTDYQNPTMTIVNLQHHGMLMVSEGEEGRVGTKNSINSGDNGDTTTEDIYM